MIVTDVNMTILTLDILYSIYNIGRPSDQKFY